MKRILWAAMIGCMSWAVQPSHAGSFALEADAAAYALSGYSGIARYTFDRGFDVALGGGRFDLPGFVVETQENFDAMQWKAEVSGIQVFRSGYRFHGAHRNGPAIGVIVMNQAWEVESRTLRAGTSFKVLSAGLTLGYYQHFGSRFYLYPTMGLTSDSVYDGEHTVLGNEYKVAPLGVNGSVHMGWEFGRE